jgi:hypothetical protein
MENETKKAAQEFIDEVMSGKYQNIEIDDNGYIDHYGCRYKLIAKKNGKILVDYKPTALFWISTCISGVLGFLAVMSVLGFNSINGDLRAGLAIICLIANIMFISCVAYVIMKQLHFQRYINNKFKRFINK